MNIIRKRNEMINNVVLIGRFTKDADVRQTQNGARVAMFNLAVTRPFKDANGNREADFISCVAWRKTAEIIQQYTHKGSLIGVNGRIQTRNYQDKDGKTVYVTEVVVEQISLLDPKNSNSNNHANATPPEDPFAGQMDITADDLPF